WPRRLRFQARLAISRNGSIYLTPPRAEIAQKRTKRLGGVDAGPGGTGLDVALIALNETLRDLVDSEGIVANGAGEVEDNRRRLGVFSDELRSGQMECAQALEEHVRIMRTKIVRW